MLHAPSSGPTLYLDLEGFSLAEPLPNASSFSPRTPHRSVSHCVSHAVQSRFRMKPVLSITPAPYASTTATGTCARRHDRDQVITITPAPYVTAIAARRYGESIIPAPYVTRNPIDSYSEHDSIVPRIVCALVSRHDTGGGTEATPITLAGKTSDRERPSRFSRKRDRRGLSRSCLRKVGGDNLVIAFAPMSGGGSHPHRGNRHFKKGMSIGLL